MKHIFLKLPVFSLILAGLFFSSAEASIVINSTRVIYPSDQREVTIKLTNTGKAPALVQTWLDSGDTTDSPSKIDVPFLITPSIFRLDPEKGQTLRLIHVKSPMPEDKESLYWLNVLEVPPKLGAGANEEHNADGGMLKMALRTRIKVMYRPKGLPGSADEAPQQVSWEIVKSADGKSLAVKATNPTPYVVNLGGLKLIVAGKYHDAGGGLVKPGETALFPLSDLASVSGPTAELVYASIDDWGSARQATLSVPVRTAP